MAFLLFGVGSEEVMNDEHSEGVVREFRNEHSEGVVREFRNEHSEGVVRESILEAR